MSTNAPWWQGAIGYQVYIRSFQDTTGDGVGDLEGIRRRLPHLAALGVDIVWVTPFYTSPQADHGYDVADYTGVEPTFGDLGSVDALVSDAHALGLKLVLDLVPNHSSSEHPWFLAALEGDERYRDYYVWRDPAPDGGPPNNWVAHFGGSAWTLDERSGQYYMHLFLPEQPDLNWDNPAVRHEFDDILRFWFERGVDGVRIDVAHSLTEDPEFRDNPLKGEAPAADAHPKEIFGAYEHRYDLDQHDNVEVYKRWRGIAEQHDAVLIGEVYLLDAEKLARYVTDRDGLHSAFNFAALHTGWVADEIREAIVPAVEAAGDGLSWPLSSHDDPRAATRFGGGRIGARRQLAYWTFLCSLPGMPFIYQGDELGLSDGAISVSADPMSTRNEGAVGRDGSRTPVVWEAGDGFGFTTGEPWLPFGDNRVDADTAAAQMEDPHSHLSRVIALHRVRRDLDALTGDAPTEWLDTPAPVVALRRGDVVSAMNTAADPVAVALPEGTWQVVYASHDPAWTTDLGDGKVEIPTDATVWLQRTDA